MLGFAKKHIAKKDFKIEKNNIAPFLKDMIFLGMISMFDPPKKGIDDTMLKLKAAGIKIIMLTGDEESTALAVARQAKIIESKQTVN